MRRRVARRSRQLVAILLMLTSVSLVAAPSVLGADPTTLTTGLNGGGAYVNTDTILVSALSYNTSLGGFPYGNVEWDETTSGSPVVLGTTLLNGSSCSGCSPFPVSLTIAGGLSLGSHTVVATFTTGNTTFASSSSAPFTFEVTKVPTATTLGQFGPTTTIETHHSIDLIGGVTETVLSAGGTMSVWRVGALAATCTGGTGVMVLDCPVANLAIGSYDYVTKFSGTATLAASESAPLTVTVVADTVHVHNVGVLNPSIYPVIDGYQDSDSIRGVRDEPISVAIKVYNSSNSLVRSASFALASGSYSYLWNGRNSAGSILPEGTYHVVQVLKDAAGTVKAYGNYVALSKKHLIYHTAYLTKLGSSFNSSGHVGSATVTRNTTSGYVKLAVPGDYVNWAGAGWEFVLPSAVLYKSMSFRVYGHVSSVPADSFVGAQNWGFCARGDGTYWDESCFSAWHTVGLTTGGQVWSSTGSLSASYRYGRYVRGIVSAYSSTTYIYKAQVVVTYALLGY